MIAQEKTGDFPGFFCIRRWLAVGWLAVDSARPTVGRYR